MTSGRHLEKSNQPSLPHHGDYKTRKQTKYSITKQGQNTESSQTMEATIKNKSTTTEPLS